MDHLEEAKRFVEYADTGKLELAVANAQVATAHALIVQAEDNRVLIALVKQIAERLPPPAETASERHVRLQKEEYDAKIQD